MADKEEMTVDDEMLQMANNAAKVQTTLATAGWKDVVKPMLQSRREYFLSNLLSKQERMEDVVFAQQSVLAIDELLNSIEYQLAEGKRADEYFKDKG